MEQLPLAWNGDTEFGIVQWESQGHALTVTVQCPLLTDDIYRAYWHDKNGQECLLFVLEPIKNQLFGKKTWSVNHFSLPPKSAYIRGKHQRLSPPPPAPVVQELESWVQDDPLLCQAAGRETVTSTAGALYCAFEKDQPVELLFAAATGKIIEREGDCQLWIFPRSGTKSEEET